MQRWQLSLSTLIAGLVCVACAGDKIPVSVAFDPVVRFPAQATYAWDRAAIRLPTDPHIVELHPERLIEELAEEAFAARGYTRVNDPQAADYLLSYHLQVATFIGADASNSSAVLSLLLVEPKTERRVWMGWGRAEYFAGADSERRRTRIADALARMLEDFPPVQSGPK